MIKKKVNGLSRRLELTTGKLERRYGASWYGHFSKKGSVELNESLGRELIARSLIVPALKTAFKRNLRAILLVGSSQKLVRNAKPAFNYESPSDLDVVYVVDRTENRHAAKLAGLALRDISHFCLRTFDITLETKPIDSVMFKETQVKEPFPFQILYGVDWVRSQLGDEFLESRIKLVKNAREREAGKHLRGY